MPSFYDIIVNEPPVLTLLDDIMNGITACAPALSKHKSDFASYAHLWETDKARFMGRYSRSVRPLMQVCRA